MKEKWKTGEREGKKGKKKKKKVKKKGEVKGVREERLGKENEKNS